MLAFSRALASLSFWISAVVWVGCYAASGPGDRQLGGISAEDRFSPGTVDVKSPPSGDFPYQLQDNTVYFGHRFSYGCNFVLGGAVTDAHGDPVTDDIQVWIQLLNDAIQPTTYSRPGWAPERGESGWSGMVSVGGSLALWLQRASTSERLSDVVFVVWPSCEQNLAIINFVEVQAPPHTG